MSILKQNKTEKRSSKSSVITSRVTEEEYKAFEELCNETGHSVSEALRLLVLNEISPSEKKKPQELPTPKKEIIKTPKERPVRSSISFGRFTTEKWKIDGFLPCPICYEWISSSNYSRHAKGNHEMTTKELIQSNIEIVDQMANSKRSDIEE